MNEEDAAKEDQNTELGSVRPPGMAPSADYSGLARNLDAGTASISLDAANDVDPDNAAAINNTAKKLGASPKLVESSYDSALKELKRREQEEALRGRPRTQKYLTDPDKARLASDDVSILGEIENTFTYGPQAPASGFIKYSGSVPSGIARLRESYRKFELEQLGDIRGDSWREFSKSLDQFFGDLGDDLKKFGASIEVPADKKNYVLDVLEVGGQMAGQALPLAIPLVGPALGTSLMVVAGADETGEILDKTPGGSDTDRFLALALGGATTGVLEKIGIDKLIDGIGVGKNIKNRFTRFLVNRTLGGAAIEVTEETAEAALRDGIVKLLVDPKREILEDFTAYEASVAGGAGGLFRSVLGIRRARSTGDDLRDQIDKARQSKLLGRDPEAFEEFYQSLVDGTESDEVRVSVEGLVNELNQTGGDPVEFLTTLGVDLAEAQKALDNGGDVSVNRGKFVTEIAATEGRDDILRHVRSDDGAMTVAEAEVESAAIQERVAEAVAQFNETGEMPAAPTPEIATQAEEIGARIAEQIDASGKYTRQGSKAIGSVYEALFRTIASDYAAEGKEFDLEGIAAELGVDVRAVPFADRASPVTGDETLGGPQREPFDQETSGFPLAVGEDRQFPVEGAINSMTPDEFLDRAPPLEIDEEARETIDALKAHIQSGGRLDALIADTRTDEEKAAGVNRGREDGRHRAMAAKELGIDSVPVITPGTPQPAEQSGFDDYRAQVDPGGRTIPAEDRPNLRMGDMYGMLPQDAEVVSELDDGITIYRGPNGDYYATALNPDLGEQDVVGYIQGGDNGTELAVVQEMQGRGIGSELQYLFRSENPFAPTGGLTEAGARRLEGTYNRLYDEGVITPEELDLQQTAREFDVSPEVLRAELDAAGGDITQTPRFKAWFGDSKIVDADGNPTVVYHGTQYDIEAFNVRGWSSQLPSTPERDEYMASFGPAGMYFSADPLFARTYAGTTDFRKAALGDAGPVMYPVYLSLQNPKIIKDLTFWEEMRARIKDARDGLDAIRKGISERETRLRASTAYLSVPDIKKLEAEGYDGIINEKANEIIVFRPEQIKSQMNRGAFDPTDPNILKQAGRDLLTDANKEKAVRAANELGELAADLDAPALRDEALTDNGLMYVYDGELQPIGISDVDKRVSDPSALADGSILEISDITDWSDIVTLGRAIDLAPSDFSSFVFTPDDFKIEVYDTGEGFAGNLEIDYNAIEDRVRQQAVQDNKVDTIEDALNHPSHMVRGAAFASILDDLGVEYSEDGSETASRYFYVSLPAESEFEQIKVRFADHIRQSGLHLAADFNVADGGYDTAMQALDRIVAGNNLGTVFQGGTQDFQKFIEGSKVVDKNGAPLRVFRGEHGEVTGSVTTLLPSITFTDQPAEASLYAQDPNQYGLDPEAPRVSPAYLSIKNPIMNDPYDPFINYSALIDALGLEKTIEIARRNNLRHDVRESQAWEDNFYGDYDSLQDLLRRDPERLGELYTFAYMVLDDPGAVEALTEAGYDGAIHGGFGDTVSADPDTPASVEYRVFDESQIRSAVAPDELFQRDEGLQDDGGHAFRISTRLPTTMRAEEDPVAENLKVDLEAMRFKPAAFKHNMELVKKYPGFSTRSRNPDKIAEEFLEFTTNNLLWLFDSVPPETRERSKLWYDGARAMSERIAEDHGIPVQSVAAVMAALSPQKDWYQNASLGERLIDIHQKFTQGNAIAFMPDNKMKATSRRIFGKDKYKKQRLAVMKSTYADLTEAGDRAMWLRIYDETYNPRGFRVLSPEGNFVGEPSGNVAWGSLVEITKAVRALEDPSLENLTAIMGAKHKVRNFYNNILAPNAPDGDVTIDTHAVAAALIRGLSGGSAEVHHNFGSSPGKDKQPKGWQAAKNINDNGAQGTYGIYAEAYRRAAKQRGVSPRELQSITWEAARGLFTAKFKQNAKNVAAIDAIWYDYQRGKIDLDEARNRILERADGINQPDWVDQRDTDNAEIGDTSYAGELARLRVSRRDPGRLGTRDGDPGGTGELFQGDDGGGGVARLYSAARRATQSLKQEKATAQQWLSHFKKSGVKDDEITWIVGLEEFLNSQKGAISRDDVRAFVDQNGIQVRETVLNTKPPPVREWATEVAIPVAERYLVDENYTLEAGEAGTNIFLDDFLVREGLTDAEVVEYAESLDFDIGIPPGQPRKKGPQFTQYSMDGDRENDQEFYLNLPAKLSTGNATVKDWTQPYAHRIGETLSDTRNIIRIRTNNRTFEDGRKVLFIEEMQDDRGQAARDLGVQEMDYDIRAEAELAEAEFAALNQYALDLLDDTLENVLREELGETRDAGELLVAFRDANDEFEATNSRFTWEDRFQDHAELMSEDTRAAVNEYIEAALSGERIDGRMQSNRVPARPFIGSNKVLPLALKRMIIEAVEQGQDAIAWTPGDVQNDRYNLRRVVDKLRLYSNKDGNFRNVVTLHGIKDGNVRFKQDVTDVDELSKLIGKDRAEKMFADLQVSETNESLLEGDDLDIGGEGMRKYYDKMVVSQANTIGKKFGAKVEVGQTRAGNNERDFNSEIGRERLLRAAGYGVMPGETPLNITQETIPFPEPVFAETLEAESRELEAKRMELEFAIFNEMRDTDFYQRTEENRDGFFPRKPQDFIRAIQDTVPNSILEVEQFPGYDDLPAAQKFLITEYLEVFYERAETDAMAAYGEQYLTRLQIDAPSDGYPLDLMIPSMEVSTNVIADRALWNQVQGALEKSQDVWTLPITDKMREAVTGPGLPLFQDPKDPLGSFNPTERVINLFEKADQSTLLHESGHAFVDILGRLVARGDAPARIVDNYNAMLNWVGAESANDLNLNINGDAAREKQERLAMAFEAYLMEGQAPSAELQGAFQMFRQWLINIYRRVRRLEVEVDPTISAVFDRMLATDNEIAEMEQVNAFDFTASPSVTSIMSDEERARHDALSAAASEAARNERVLEERAAEAREQQAWWQEEYQNALERAEAAVYERPEYKAYYFLTKGEFYNGNTPANLEGRRISKQALLDLGYTQQQLNSLPRGARRIYTTKDEAATDPELFAAYFGFADTNEMMDVFLSMRPAKDAIEFDAGTIMRSEHGDPMNDGTMERITEERLFNDERYSAIEMELNALATQTGQQAVGRRLVKAIVDRVFAEETVGGLLTPMRYQAASVRAAREAERAAAKGDFEKAFMKKRQQLLNHEMFRRSLQARDEIQKISQKMKTYQRRKYSPKQVDPEYIGEIKSFLSFFEFGQRSKSGQIKAEQAKALMDFIEARQAKGMPIILPGELVEVASLDPETGAPNVVFKTKHWRDMTMPEIRGLRDMADNLYKIGRDNSAEKKAERRARGEELADGILASTKRRRGKQDPLSIPTREEKVKESKRSRFSAWHRKMESMLYQLDGFKNLGPMYRGVFEKLARASDVKTQLVEKARTDFDDALRLYDKDVLAKMQTAKSAASIAALGGARLTREQRVTIALNWGSESNREAVLEDDARKKQFGALWNEDAIQQILETLDDTDWAFVQKIWTDIDSYWEDISLKDGSTIDGVKSLEMEQTGIAPPKVEASPFVVGERELPGGYYPLMYDNLSDARAHKETEQDLLNKLQSGGFTRAATSHGFTIARVGSGGRPVRLDLGVLYAHLDEVSQDLAYREAIQQAAEILGNNDVQEAIRATMGEPYRKSLEAILLATATGNMHSSDAAKDLPILRTARLNVTVGVMGFNMRSLLTQPLGLTQSIARIGAKEVGKGVAWLFANPTKINERIASVNELSAYMTDRAKTMTRELDDMTSKLGRESRLDKIRQFGYAPMVFLDVVTVAYPTWWGAFDSAMNGRAEGIDAGDEKSAILYADNIVRTTQGSGGAQNLSMVQQSSEAMKLLTMFYGYFNTTFNLQAEAYNRARADGSSLPRALLKRDFIGQTMMLQIIPAILAGLLLEKWPDEEELEEDATWAWTKWSLAQFVNHGGAQMAVVRDVASGITSPFGFSITAADSFGKAAVDVGKFSVKYIESQVDEDEEFELSPAAAKGLARSLGQLGGIPGTSQLVRTGDYLYKLSRDELKREPENVAELLQGALMLGDR